MQILLMLLEMGMISPLQIQFLQQFLLQLQVNNFWQKESVSTTDNLFSYHNLVVDEVLIKIYVYLHSDCVCDDNLELSSTCLGATVQDNAMGEYFKICVAADNTQVYQHTDNNLYLYYEGNLKVGNISGPSLAILIHKVAPEIFEEFNFIH